MFEITRHHFNVVKKITIASARKISLW